MGRSVTVEAENSPSVPAVTFTIRHPVLASADKEVLAACAERILECAEKNGCFAGGVKFTQKCLETVSSHNSESGCVDSCFGCR